MVGQVPGDGLLFSSPAGRDTWARDGSTMGDPSASLAMFGRAAWFVSSGFDTADGTYLWRTADVGAVAVRGAGQVLAEGGTGDLHQCTRPRDVARASLLRLDERVAVPRV
jgi:hypothetical protein